jgi:hypothetical protein
MRSAYRRQRSRFVAVAEIVVTSIEAFSRACWCTALWLPNGRVLNAIDSVNATHGQVRRHEADVTAIAVIALRTLLASTKILRHAMIATTLSKRRLKDFDRYINNTHSLNDVHGKSF